MTTFRGLGTASSGVALVDETSSVKEFGATGNGVTDDTSAIQSALDWASTNKATIIFNAGTYLIDSDANTLSGDKYGVHVKDNTHVHFEKGAVLQSETNSSTHYAVMMVSGDDILIDGAGTLIGDRTTHTGSTGEYGHVLDVRNSDRVIIKDVTVKDGWGDGLYVGSHVTDGETCNDITISNVTCLTNRRNNCSIVDVDTCFIDNCRFDGANGTAPQAGIDIEPNTGDSCKNITLVNCSATGNTGNGFLTVGNAASVFRVSFSNCISISNSLNGFQVKNSDYVVFSNCHATSNTENGIYLNITDDSSISNCTSSGNTLSGINIITSKNCTVSGNTVFENDQHGILVDTVCTNTTVIGNNVFNNSQATDVTYDNIIVDANCDENVITGNNVSAGSLTNSPRYGININSSNCENSVVTGNMLEAGGDTANFNDSGTNTVFESNYPRGDIATAAADDTTPSVKHLKTLTLPANTGATAITQLDDGRDGQKVTLFMSSSTNSSTITDGGNFALNGNWTPNTGDTITLVNAGNAWREIARSPN